MDWPIQHENMNADAVIDDRPVQEILNVDCWQKIFDYISFDELYNMSQTCKRLRQIGGRYFQENFPILYGSFKGDGQGICFRIWESDDHVPQNGLNEFIQKVVIRGELKRYLRIESFRSIRELTLSDVELNARQIGYIREILPEIEALNILSCNVVGDLFEQLLQYCLKLKTLQTTDLYFLPPFVKNSNNWLKHSCPTLEHLELYVLDWEPTDLALMGFLEKNPNIKCFGTDLSYIWKHARAFLGESKIQLDRLTIHFHESMSDVIPIDEFVNVLKGLQVEGFYRSLHLAMNGTSKLSSREMVNYIAPLRVLKALCKDVNIDFQSLVQLKELYIPKFRNHSVSDMLAKNLVNIEQLCLEIATINDALPFVRHAKKLRAVRVFSFNSESFFVEYAVDLVTLEKERQKLKKELQGLVNPTKVLVYVDERSYLATKWQVGNLRLDLVNIEQSKHLIWVAYGDFNSLDSIETNI